MECFHEIFSAPASERFPSLEIIRYYWYRYECRWEASNKYGEQVRNRREGWGDEKMGHNIVQETRHDPYFLHSISFVFSLKMF